MIIIVRWKPAAGTSCDGRNEIRTEERHGDDGNDNNGQTAWKNKTHQNASVKKYRGSRERVGWRRERPISISE